MVQRRADGRSGNHSLSLSAMNWDGKSVSVRQQNRLEGVYISEKRLSTSVRLDEFPDVVQVLENDPLCTHEAPPTQWSVKISTAGPESRAERDVATFDNQGPCECFFIVREVWGVCSPWHRQTSQVAHWDWGMELDPKVKPDENSCER